MRRTTFWVTLTALCAALVGIGLTASADIKREFVIDPVKDFYIGRDTSTGDMVFYRNGSELARLTTAGALTSTTQGASTFSSTVALQSTTTVGDDTELEFGDDGDADIKWDTAATAWDFDIGAVTMLSIEAARQTFQTTAASGSAAAAGQVDYWFDSSTALGVQWAGANANPIRHYLGTPADPDDGQYNYDPTANQWEFLVNSGTSIITASAAALTTTASVNQVWTADNGSTITRTYNAETLTFAADPGDATKTTTDLVPSGARVLSVTTRQLVAGTNCATFSVGEDGGDTDAFGAAISIAVDATTDTSDYTQSGLWNPCFGGTCDVIITPNANCFDTSIRVEVVYETTSGPTG